jgi:hypothetical protein
MNYLMRLSDSQNRYLVVFTLDEKLVQQPAVDVVFEIIGGDNAQELVAAGTLSAGQVEDLRALQKIIFDRDQEGMFINEKVNFIANGQELNAEAPLSRAFVPSERDGLKYMRLDLVVVSGNEVPQPTTGSNSMSIPEQIKAFSRLLFIRRLAKGTAVDVTNDYPELTEVIAWGEKENLIEIDVKKATYKLTDKGRRLHDSYIAEAQDLIKRFDIYGDVDVDGSGRAHFDTGLGRDLRVAAFEMEGVDPFRARFLIGINDGEFDQDFDWISALVDEGWYREIFAPVERAPSIEEIGRDNMARIMDQAKELLRQ